jgi:acetolactate synthase-1/2/3 large subunit
MLGKPAPPTTTGNELVARALKAQGVEAIFYLMGGPMLGVLEMCVKQGFRMIDTRHEQGAALMAHGYSRISGKVGVCIVSSGPGVTNAVTGIAGAFVDCAPMVLLGGSTPLSQRDADAFQDINQLEMLRPIVKWATRVHDVDRLGEYVDRAFQIARGGRPGPVYLELPGDVLYRKSVVSAAIPVSLPAARSVPSGNALRSVLDAFRQATRPIVIAGSGCWWSDASAPLAAFAETLGVPVFTTPAARGLIPEDHPLTFPAARSHAFSSADLIFLVGTRANYVLNFLQAPRFSESAEIIQLDITQDAIRGSRHISLPLVGDAKATLVELADLAKAHGWDTSFAEWLAELRKVVASKQYEQSSESIIPNGSRPIRPEELCRSIAELMRRDPTTILVLDGHEILNFARQIIPVLSPHAYVSPGPFGCMGVGVPFAVGAKCAAPDREVVCLSGDGSFGINAMEVDTALRHNLKVTFVVSNNGGWTALQNAPGRDLGLTRFDSIVTALGGTGILVDSLAHLDASLREALNSARASCVNVVTDPSARSHTQAFTRYSDDATAAYF